MSYSSEESGNLSQSLMYQSDSIDDSFQIISSHGSVETENDTAERNQRNHISLTEQETAADHSTEIAEETRDGSGGDSSQNGSLEASTPHGTSPPIPKPRTLLHSILPSDSSTASEMYNSPSPLTRTRSFTEKGVTPQTPPTPRPRSGEQKKLKAQWEVEKQALLEQLEEAKSKSCKLKSELDVAQERINELESELQDLPAVDVEVSLREKESALRAAEEESLRLQRLVQERDSALREKQNLLQKKDSRIVGLEEEVRTITQPLRGDIKKRVEIRLSEAMGQVMQKEVELSAMKKEREEYEDEIARERGVREGLEREKRELRSEVEKLQREREGDNVKFQKQISSLQAERAKLEDEKLHLEGEKMQHVEKERDSLQQEVERLRVESEELKVELDQVRERVQLAEQGREKKTEELQQKMQSRERELQEQLQQQLKEAETEKHLLLQQHREQCESLKQSLGEKDQGCSSLQQQLAATNTARESAETSLKNERAISQKLHQERDDLQTTCEAFKGEVNSLLADLQEQTSTIKTLEEERDALRNQGDGLRRKFAENQERMRKLEEDVGRGQEREKRLQDQRDGLQNREELMDLQLKQYISDFNEERAAREKMSEVVRLLEAREKDSNAQIALLRKQVTDLSTEKNDLSAQNEHLRLQLQQFQQ